jgi:hypothetical protein
MRRSIFGRLDGARSLLMRAAIITVSVSAITVWPPSTRAVGRINVPLDVAQWPLSGKQFSMATGK